MVSHMEPADVSDVRQTALLLSNDGAVSEAEIEVARVTLGTIIGEAEEFGITKAEVIKAVLMPVLGPPPSGCDCFSCRARRGDA